MEHDAHISIVPSGYAANTESPFQKLVVFDLDETIGDFYMFYNFWRFLQQQYEYSPQYSSDPGYILAQPAMNQLLDLYPEFFRPGIFIIFQYLQHKKSSGALANLWLYTNNTLSPKFPIFIQQYIHYFIGYPLFDNIILTLSILNRRVDERRVHKEKEYADFIHCYGLFDNGDICFVDNDYHEGMVHRQIFYIKPSAYRHGLSFDILVERFMGTSMSPILFSHMDSSQVLFLLTRYMQTNQIQSNCGTSHPNAEFQISRRLLSYIKQFFDNTTAVSNRTRKRLPARAKTRTHKRRGSGHAGAISHPEV